MDYTLTNKTSNSLVGQVKRHLLLSVSLLIGILILRIALSLFTFIYQNNLSAQKVFIHDDINGILTTMVDQETGLRGYISTDDSTFLAPFTSGWPQYRSYLEHLKRLVSSASFNDTAQALTNVEVRADDWHTNYAIEQIKNMQAGSIATARAEVTVSSGKTLFDMFRAAMTQLQDASNREINTLEVWSNTLNILSIIVTALLSVLVIMILWHMFTRFAKALHTQLEALATGITRLGTGDLAVRVQRLSSSELDSLGQTLNSMATTIQQQQQQLNERDVLENVLQLNTILTRSLDFEVLMQEFLNNVLTSLELQLVALYLYNAHNKSLTLIAVQGFDDGDMQQEFQLGEGAVGLTALNRTPIYLHRPKRDEVDGFKASTIFGTVLPASIYQLPLIRGNELVGVLSVGSIYSINENTRNVLNVIASTLSAAITNTRAYRHIREQATELTLRTHEQERANVELRQQRDELTVLNAALEEANRVRSQFLSTMSHELRTPLAAIIGFTQMLLRDLEQVQGTQRQKNNLERILKNGRHLLNLINGVLDLAKMEAGRMNINYSQIELKELLSSVVEETQSIAIEQKLAVYWQVEDGVDAIESDPVKLRQILLNLVSNALKFTPQGKVTLSATAVAPSKEGEECIAIAVTDTGIGIAPDIQERIFEAFYQADSGMTRKFGGTGLGLSIVRQLTTLLEGTLQVKSVPGEGSTFTIVLPIKASRSHIEQDAALDVYLAQSQAMPTLLLSFDQATAGATYMQQPAPPVEASRRPLVLAVDDNQDVLNLVTASLEHSPFRVVGVQDPLRVMEVVQELKPCAITLDVMMPNLNGWQILHQLKNDINTASIPVIMLTILSERTTGYVLGADDYLIKPFDSNVLIKVLQRLTAVKVPAL